MIEDPPLLTLQRTNPRPEAANVAMLGDAPTGFLVDCLNGRGALDYRIKALSGLPVRAFGVALTCQNGPDDNLGLLGAVHIAQAGDFIVAATEGFTNAAVTGDLVLGMARNRGVTGFVTDGLIRDVDGCRKVGLPAYSAGVSPNSPVRSGPGSAGLPINLGSVHVRSGDVVVADEDGVVIVPFDRVDDVIVRLATIREKEAEMDRKVMEDGLDGSPVIDELIESGGVRFVDKQ